MSTKSIPGMGKSGNCLRAACRLFLTRASSAALEATEVGWGSDREASLEAVVVMGGERTADAGTETRTS